MNMATKNIAATRWNKNFGIFSFWRAEIIGETVTFHLHFSNVDWFKTKDMLLLLICEQN